MNLWRVVKYPSKEVEEALENEWEGVQTGKERAGDTEVAAGKEDEAGEGAESGVFLLAASGFVPFEG